MKKNFDWDYIWGILGILFIIFIIFFIIFGLITNTKETLVQLGFIVGWCAICYACYMIYNKTNTVIKQSDFKKIMIGLLYTSTFIIVPILDTLDALLHSETILTSATLLFTLLSVLSSYSVVSLFQRKQNTIFVLRCTMSIFILAVLIGFIKFFLQEAVIIDSFVDFLNVWIYPFLFLICIALDIKGLCITFGSDAEKLFPKAERRIPFVDVVIVLLLLYSILYVIFK